MNEEMEKTQATMDTAIIATSRMEELARFYGQGLDLGEAHPAGPDHLGFDLPNAYFGFDLIDTPPEPSGVLSLWFRVNDLAVTLERFKGLGAKVKYPPTKKPWGDELAAMYDLDGNLFGLAQRKQAS